MKTDVAADGQPRSLDARDTLERQPRARQVENGLAIGGVVSEISGQQTRGGWIHTYRRRHQAQFGVGDAHFAVMDRHLTPRSIEAPAPGLRIDYIEEAGQLRIGVRSAAMKGSAEQAMRRIGISEQRLQPIRVSTHESGIQLPGIFRLETPVIQR